jgi:hypothetical protein
LVKLKKNQNRVAHRQPPGLNHGPTVSRPRRLPSDSGRCRLAAPTASLPPFPRPPSSTASGGYKGSHPPPWSTLFFLLHHFTAPTPAIPSLQPLSDRLDHTPSTAPRAADHHPWTPPPTVVPLRPSCAARHQGPPRRQPTPFLLQPHLRRLERRANAGQLPDSTAGPQRPPTDPSPPLFPARRAPPRIASSVSSRPPQPL